MTENNKTELEEGDDVSQLQLDDVQGGSRGSKKPRRASRPKVKTGCNNCKVRRVKCDETKPTCSRCPISGRVCDGYPAYAERWKSENQMAAASSSGLTEYSENSEPNVFIKLPSIKEHLSEFGFGEERYMLYDKSQSVGSLQMIPGKSRSESSSGVYNAITPAENQRSPGPFRHEPSAGSEFQLYECRHLGCGKVFKFFHEFTRHVINCEYLEYGWQTEEELYRHRYFKHDGPVPFFECLFKPCKFKERRQDKCKDHMLKAHGWRGVWPKMRQEQTDKRLLSEQLLLKQPRNSSGSSVDTDAVCEEGNMNPNTGLQTFAGGELNSSEQLAEARFERGPLYCPFPGCDYQSFGEEQWREGNLKRHTREKHGMNRNGGRQEASRVRGAEVAFAPTWSHDCSMTPEDDRPVPHLLVPYLDALSSTEEHNGMYSAGFYNNQQVANNWDLQSIASMDTCRDSALGSSLPSAKSTSSVQGLPQAAKEETLIIINSDSQLQVLLEGIALKIDKTRFIRNVRRLIVHFTQDLEQSAIDPREKDVINILKLHASWFASRLFDLSGPNKDSELRAMAPHLDQNVDKRLLLERYLRNLSGSSADTDAVCEEENVDSNAIDVDDAAVGIDYSNFPNLERIKRFMTRGTAFETLRRNTSQFAGNEQPLPEHMSGQWKQKRSSVSASQKFRFALAKQAKLVMTTQKFLKLIKAHSSLRSYPSTDQAMLDVSEPLPQSPEAKSLNENSDTSLDTYMTTLTDVESSTDDTDYESDDLPDDPELLAFTEERIINPKAYFHKLESLERHVFSNSGLFIHETGISSGPSQDEALLCLPAPRYHKDQTDFLISIIQYSNSKPLLELLVCHNRAHRAGNNLISLQENGYCTRHFSILLQDQYRAGVVRVVQIEIQIVLDLAKAFRRSMNALMANFNSRSHHHMLTMVEIDGLILEYDKQFALTRMCQETLDNIFAPHDVASRPLQTFVWQLTTEIIELAILSYAGAHIQPFDVDLMGKDIPSFRIPQRFQYHDTTLNRLGDLPHISDTSRRGVEIRRRQLQCMDGFLGKKQPWVFHNFNNDSPVDNTRLCLSSTIEALTDLWGPSWKIVRNSSPCEINQYDIGNGAIIPWTVQDGGRDNWPDYVSSEVFCHWIPFKDWNEDEVEANQASLPRRYLLSSDILLIGARNDYGLLVNDKCVPSPASILRTKSRLSDQQALRSPNTSRPRRYVDSHAIQIQGSAMGFISGASQVTYKRRSGHTMKDALVERWRHGLRNPIDLEAYFGIEISLCSRNARRRRLLNILASDTMVNYLHAISFVWGAGVCERAYLKALRCPKSFRKFWKAHKEWQPNIGDAISKCLDALEETGIDEDNQELSAFWVESFDAVGDSDGEDDDDFLGQPDATKDDDSDHGNQSAVQVTTATGIPTPPKSLISLDSDSCKFFEEWIVTLFRSEHTWTGFLEDSEKSLTMAVVGMNCLDFHDRDGFGRCCSLSSKPKGYPVLQTSLQINESLLSGYLEKLKQEKVDGGRKIIWNARELKRGATFCLGNHGRLEVISGPSKLCPVVVEWMGVKGGKIVGGLMKEMKNVGVNENLFGKGVQKHHKEFIRGCWEVKPLPVLILSKSTKVRFGKD